MANDGDVDYSTYTRAELEEARASLDPERFPLNGARLLAEIERRDQADAEAPAAPDAPVRHRFEFCPDPKEYFRIWIVNLALTIVTLGIYSAWAKVRRLRYFYSSTTLAGSSFGYHGEPIKILKGRLIAAVLAAAYVGATQTSRPVTMAVVVLLAAATPWLIVRSRMFAMRVTSWRGLRFDFEDDYVGAYRALLVWLIGTFVSGGLLWPRATRERYRFIVSRTRFGTTAFKCEPRIAVFYKTAFKVLGLMIVCIFVLALAGNFLVLVMKSALAGAGDLPPRAKQLFALAPVIGAYLVILPVVLGFTQARNLNEVFNHTTYGPSRVLASYSAAAIIGIYFTNMLGIVLTLGLYMPWAEIRIARYRLDHLEVEGPAELADIRAADVEPVPAATGEEISSLLDVDFGF